MNKLYLTPSETRRYAVELPVGDPWSGPAFGKKTMPVVAIAMAATSFAGGMAAFSAATTLGGMIAAGATMVGSALTIVGTITGNSKLAKIGGVLTLGGALAGGIANPFGGTEAATETAADTISSAAAEANAAVDATNAASTSTMQGATDLNILDAPSTLSQTPANVASDVASRGVINQTPDSMSWLDSPQIAQPSQGVTQASLGADVANPLAAQAPNAMSVGGTQAGQATQNNVFNAGDIIQSARNDAQGLLGSTPGTGLGGYFDKFGRWVKDNKELAYIGANFASGLLPSDRDRAMTEAYQQRAEADRRRALWATGRTQ